MGQIDIVIPSHNRAERVLSKRLVSGAIICVPDSQYKAYKQNNPECEIVAHPDSVVGLPPKLDWIRRNFDNVFYLDDDATGFKRRYATGDTLLNCPDTVREIIEATAHNARAAGAYLFGFAKDPNPMTFNALSPIKLTGFVLGGSTGLLSGSKLYWDTSLQINGDYWISGLNAYYHRLCYKDMRFCFVFEKTFTNKGGLAGVRNSEMLQRHYEHMKASFGDAIVRKKFSRADVRKQKSEYEMRLVVPF